jgi:hypothetical protein
VLHVAQQTCFFRKSLYDRVGGLNLALHCTMDTDLWIRMLQAGSVWGHIPQYLAGFRLHDSAKGLSWLKEYAKENEVMRQQHPQYIAHSRSRIGLTAYRAMQILSGRHLRAASETRQHRGKKLTEVFGDWKAVAA